MFCVDDMIIHIRDSDTSNLSIDDLELICEDESVIVIRIGSKVRVVNRSIVNIRCGMILSNRSGSDDPNVVIDCDSCGLKVVDANLEVYCDGVLSSIATLIM